MCFLKHLKVSVVAKKKKLKAIIKSRIRILFWLNYAILGSLFRHFIR